MTPQFKDIVAPDKVMILLPKELPEKYTKIVIGKLAFESTAKPDISKEGLLNLPQNTKDALKTKKILKNANNTFESINVTGV